MVDPALQRSLRQSKECDVKLPKDSYLNYLKPMVLRNLEHASEPDGRKRVLRRARIAQPQISRACGVAGIDYDYSHLV